MTKIDDKPAPEPKERPSKTRLKKEMLELQQLGESLIDMPEPELAALDLPDRLLDAVNDAKQMTKRGALHRQKQYIGKVMRTIDPEAIRAALARRQDNARVAAARFHLVEGWRDRLIREGDTALENLIEEKPDADRQHIRQLVRAAGAEKKRGAPPKSARLLFRYIDNLMQ